MDAEKFLVKLSLGKPLSAEESGEVLDVLRTVIPGDPGSSQFAEDVYGAVLVLGKSALREHHQLIARHLDGTDPQTVSLILEILCLQWDMTEDYIEWVFRFAVGSSWDFEEDVRRAAIKVLGEYLRDRYSIPRPPANGTNDAALKNGHRRSGESSSEETWRARNGELLDLLLGIFEDDEVDPFTRQAAYSALLRVAGQAWEDLPSEYGLIAFGESSPDIDRGILARLRERRAG